MLSALAVIIREKRRIKVLSDVVDSGQRRQRRHVDVLRVLDTPPYSRRCLKQWHRHVA